MDGTVLCRLLNVVTPGSTKFKASKMPFIQVSFSEAIMLLQVVLIEDGKYRQIPRWGKGIKQ